MKDQNKGAKMGITDKDYIDELGLDPSLEGKPEINQAIVNKLREDTISEYVKQGMNPEKARKIAMREIK